MSQGIVFFVDWGGPCALLAVAIHSLQKYYSGNIHVLYGAHTPNFFVQALTTHRRITTSAYSPDYAKARWTRNQSRQCWALKPLIHKASPFDLTVLYDCDHVFVAPYDVGIFDLVRKHELISFHHPKEKMSQRAWNKANSRASVIKQILKLPCESGELPQVNGGCVGSVRGTPLLDEWMDYLEKFATCGNRCLTRLPDEFSLSYTMSRHKVPVGGDQWSYSPLSDLSDLHPMPPVMAIHFCGCSYRRGSHFKPALESALRDDYLGLKKNWARYLSCNSLIQEALDAV